MRITKFTHACVRIETDACTVVIDPGGFTEREAVDGASAVLITHEHADHLDPDNLAATEAPIYTIQAVADQLPPELRERATVVGPGDEFDVGVPVRAVGEKHAVIHPEMKHFDNSGYLLTVDGERLFHPGDSFTHPGEQVDLLFAPVHAPWNKVSEVIDFTRDVAAPRTVAVHDALLNERGLGVIAPHLTRMLGERDLQFTRLEPGSEL